MTVRNSVCFESDRGNRATRGKPVEQRGEEHTNSNHMKQTPTVHSGNRTRVLRGDQRVPSPLRYPVPLGPPVGDTNEETGTHIFNNGEPGFTFQYDSHF